jgi:hypothetical protein
MNVPYVLPCVENCVTCLRSNNFFCSLLKESLEVLQPDKAIRKRNSSHAQPSLQVGPFTAAIGDSKMRVRQCGKMFEFNP